MAADLKHVWVVPKDDPETWAVAKKQLTELKVLYGFLLCKNQIEFEAWLHTIPNVNNSLVLHLKTCWMVYYNEFGPWFTCLGDVDIPKPDTLN